MASVNNPWLRGVTGKLAGMVVQGGTTRGTTIIRERVDPYDPKTVGQRVQRVIMSTVGVAYGKMAEIADHAFEGYSGKAANMNRFRSLNANMLRQDVAAKDAAGTQWAEIFDFTPKKTQWLAINKWIMSEGSLPRIPFAFRGSYIEIPTGIPLLQGAIAGDVITYDYLLGIAVGDSAFNGLSGQGMKLGDQITVCGICRGEREGLGGGEYGGIKTPSVFSFCRLILTGKNGGNDDAFVFTGPEGGAVTGAKFISANANPLTQLNGWTVELKVKEGYFYLAFTSPSNTDQWVDLGMDGATAILSRKVNGKWLRSPSTMQIFDITQIVDQDKYRFPLSYAISDAASTINTENDLYLNNAQQAG